MLTYKAMYKFLDKGVLRKTSPDKKRPEIPGFLSISDDVELLVQSFDCMRTLISHRGPRFRLVFPPLRSVPAEYSGSDRSSLTR